MKSIIFLLLVAGGAAIFYGNFPAQRILNCEKQGVAEAICTAAEWDSEQINLLPQYNPENIKAIALQQAELNNAASAHTVPAKS